MLRYLSADIREVTLRLSEIMSEYHVVTLSPCKELIEVFPVCWAGMYQYTEAS